MSTSPPRRRGPRADLGDTRTAVLDAARRRFAEHGYEGTKLRDVAADADADVDVAPASYFFKNKDGLFAAAMELAINPADVVEQLVSEGADGLGERLTRAIVATLDDPATGAPIVALVRSSARQQRTTTPRRSSAASSSARSSAAWPPRSTRPTRSCARRSAARRSSA